MKNYPTPERIQKLPTHVHIKGDPNGGRVWLDGKELDIKPSQKVWLKSEEFAWGYGGSGPAQLALAILLNYLPKEVALSHFQKFKFRVVGHWPVHKPFEDVINLRETMIQLFNEQVGV